MAKRPHPRTRLEATSGLSQPRLVSTTAPPPDAAGGASREDQGAPHSPFHPQDCSPRARPRPAPRSLGPAPGAHPPPCAHRRARLCLTRPGERAGGPSLVMAKPGPQGPCAPGPGWTVLKAADKETGANNREAAATQTSPRTQAHAGVCTHRCNLQPADGCQKGPPSEADEPLSAQTVQQAEQSRRLWFWEPRVHGSPLQHPRPAN